MWCVLAQDGDAEAAWIAERLEARADRPVALVTDSTLIHDCRWELRVGADGAHGRLELGDGTVLDPSTLDAVVNRLCWLGAEGFVGASQVDRDYASTERYALGQAWLESLGERVINRPTGSGLCGTLRTTGGWRALARSAGAPIVAYGSGEATVFTTDADRPVLVVDGQVVAGEDLPADLQEKLIIIQARSGLDLIELRLVPDLAVPDPDGGEGWAVRDVAFLAVMSGFGEAGLDALHRALSSRGPALVSGGVGR
jgi:hypothetical protein